MTTIQEGGSVEVCLPSDTCKSGGAGNAPGKFNSPTNIAVDNSGGPSEGDVYVVDRGYSEPRGNGQSIHETITKFDPAGNVIASWGTGGQFEPNLLIRRPADVVVDSAGRLNLQSEFIHSEIARLDGSTGSVVDTLLVGELHGSRLAIEPGGTFLELSDAGGAQRFDPSLPDERLTNELFVSKRNVTSGSSSQDLAVDPVNGDLYISADVYSGGGQPAQIRLYSFDSAGNVIQAGSSICTPSPRDPTGGNQEGCDPTLVFGIGALTHPRGIDVNGTTRKIYVVDSGQLKIFSTLDLSPPTLTGEDPTDVTGTSVTLHGEVDPEGLQVTDCHFSYVDDVEFQANGYANAADSPCSPDPGSGSGDVPVSAEVSGLDPATVYHFRFQAENSTASSTVTTADRSFTTLGPIITDTHANPVTATDATLNATINPQGAPTTYHFDYGPTSSYGSSTPESTPIGGSVAQAVSEQIAGLAPATNYHFRLVAQGSDATIQGPDATFTTAGATDSCPNAAMRSGHGFNLPDCRAYEQASQVDKHGAHALTSADFGQASANGDGVTYAAIAGLPVSGGNSNPYPVIARRTATGWVTHGLAPVLPPGVTAGLSGWSPTLANSFTTDPNSGAFYIGDTAAGTWSSPFSRSGSGIEFRVEAPAFSGDPAHFLLGSESALFDGAVEGKPNLYDYDHGTLNLADRVPAFPATSCDDDGGPACVDPANGGFAGSYNHSGTSGVSSPNRYPLPNLISADGSRVFFTEVGTGRLYLREDGAKTIQVSASQASTSDPNGHKPATLMAASKSGSVVYFSSCEKLTDDSTASLHRRQQLSGQKRRQTPPKRRPLLLRDRLRTAHRPHGRRH